ncbi:MAG: M20/M25/M40 family metallo-hydrolase [Lachnospiraceae bacterium]|nr:M20/M25/M40 family metallo-hydrolase [Lachnospiraceae bacterium]
MSSVNRERLLKIFTELTAIDSLSFKEGAMAGAVIRILEDLGIPVTEDDSCDRTGSDAGNLFAKFYDESKEGKPAVLFSAHMDTVAPGISKKAVLHEDGKITSDGSTILGADDVAGIAEIIEAVQEIMEEGGEHENIELFFPVAEEAFTVGSSAFDISRSNADKAFFLDREGDVGSVTMSEPTLISFTVNIKGRASHAGFAPEKGINAIVIASKAIASLPVGRVDSDTTLAIGTIEGGVAVNVVPEKAVIKGEIRSRSDEKAFDTLEIVKKAFEKEASEAGGESAFQYEKHLTAYKVPEDSKALSDYKKAIGKLGISLIKEDSFGGSDCNTFKKHCIDSICIANAMWNIHTTDEYTLVDEMVKVTEIIKDIMKG